MKRLQNHLQELSGQGMLRTLREIESAQGAAGAY